MVSDLCLGTDYDSHALNFENIGTTNPLRPTANLFLHWPLNDNLSASSDGTFSVLDHSRNSRSGSAFGFLPSRNQFAKVLRDYSYLSPSIDLKWTDNKVRVRNKSYLKLSDVAKDTNEVALEFNFVDSLNEDIVKILSTMDSLNDVIGKPVNKYRDEYEDLEGLRRIYFERLGDSINFNNFFNLFRWFDKKISDSIKQLLPSRVKFIGGEQIVESHFLERPRYKYQYPVFRTPVDIPDFTIGSVSSFSGSMQQSFTSDVKSVHSGRYKMVYPTPSHAKFVDPRGFVADVVSDTQERQVSVHTQGTDINISTVNGGIVNGNTEKDNYSLSSGVNLTNQKARRRQIISSSIPLNEYANGFLVTDFNSSDDHLHYFGGSKKAIKIKEIIYSGTLATDATFYQRTSFSLTGGQMPGMPAVFAGDTPVYFITASNNNTLRQGPEVRTSRH